MSTVMIIIILIVLGLCLGSFACATAWRLRAYQLKDDKKSGMKVDNEEYDCLKKLIAGSLLRDHSMCLNCGYRLKWYDMVPVISWLSLKGKCRKCHRKIGFSEPLAEVGLALFFVTSYLLWPGSTASAIGIAQLVLWLLAGIILTIIFIYDLKWFLIPTRLSYVVIILGLLSTILTVVSAVNKSAAIISILVSIMLLSGIYLLIYFASHKKWIGMGDVILGLGLALLLGNWESAYVALFAANFIGCLVVIPGMVRGKLKKDSHIPFGPLLIVGFWIGGLLGLRIVSALLYGIV